MSKLKLSAFIFILPLAVILTGCTVSFGGTATADRGGVFISTDKGETWQQKMFTATSTSGQKNIGSLNVNVLAMDPEDSQAIYLGSIGNGLLYTYDINQGWQIAKGLGQSTISAVTVDPKSKCIIYAAIGNSVFKSTDCNRTWSGIYHDDDASTAINSIAIDYYNSSNVFIGTSRGEVIKSVDGGGNWKTVVRLESNVKKILISPNDSRIIIAATAKKGVFRSINSGDSWLSFEDKLKGFKDGLTYRDISFSKSSPGLLILANTYGLLRSGNYGDTWEKIELITPEKEASINTIAVNPKNAKEIYYATNTTFYHTIDGGKTWATRKLPSLRVGWQLLINPDNTDILYLGVKKIAQ